MYLTSSTFDLFQDIPIAARPCGHSWSFVVLPVRLSSGYWWLVHLLCLCERGGGWLYTLYSEAEAVWGMLQETVVGLHLFLHLSTVCSCLQLFRFQLKAKILEWGSCNFLHLLSKDVKFRSFQQDLKCFHVWKHSKSSACAAICIRLRHKADSLLSANFQQAPGAMMEGSGRSNLTECNTMTVHGHKMLTRWWPLVDKQTFEHLRNTELTIFQLLSQRLLKLY